MGKTLLNYLSYLCKRKIKYNCLNNRDRIYRAWVRPYYTICPICINAK